LQGLHEAGEGVRTLNESSNSSGKQHAFLDDAVKASAGLSMPVEVDKNLGAIMQAWPSLPQAIQAGIIAMVKAALT
jgi:hypothetical protein